METTNKTEIAVIRDYCERCEEENCDCCGGCGIDGCYFCAYDEQEKLGEECFRLSLKSDGSRDARVKIMEAQNRYAEAVLRHAASRLDR